MGLKDHLFEDRTAALRAAGQPFAIATVVRTVNATSAKPGAKATNPPILARSGGQGPQQGATDRRGR